MGAESDLLETALLQFEASDFGATLTYGGEDYPCSLGTVGFGSRLVAGGFSPNAEATVVLRKSVFNPANLATGQEMTITDASGTAREVQIAAEGIRDCVYAWELTLKDLNQNA